MIKKKEADARAPEGSVGARRVGFVRLRRALRRSEWNLPPLPPEAEPRWQSSFVETAVDPDVARLRLEDFGYGEREIRALGKSRDLWAYSAPHRLLTTEGVAAFRAVCEALADRAPDDDYIVSRRVRNATSMSRFINEMMHDEGLLCRVSAIAGVPLVPHPLVNPGVCINYFDDKKVRINKVEESQVAKWHYDGMTYVFVMQLAQPTEFTGGELPHLPGPPRQVPKREERCHHERSRAPSGFPCAVHRDGRHGVYPGKRDLARRYARDDRTTHQRRAVVLVPAAAP
ncbi:hypothetical protein GZH49_32760 [Nocardia terpenica]|uniref:hypothetical protein n=1 Tax=Nocardia terpenica TaxID=455432 RepID=UPI002FE2E945